MKRKVELNYYYSADSLFTIDDIFLDTTELILTPTSRIHSHKMLATIFPFYGGSPNKYQPMYIVLVNKQTNKQEAYKIIEDLPLAVMDQTVPNQKFSLYPNPAQEYFFYYSSSTERPKRFEITDCNGRIVQSSMAENDAIQIQGLEKGLYFVKIFLNEGTNVLKLIKN